MGTDEYWVGMVKYLPAQTAPWKDLVTDEDVKSPIQLMPFYALAQVSLKMGVENAYWQFRFVQAALTTLAVAISLFAFWIFSKIEHQTLRPRLILLFSLFGFHAFLPGVLSRPMFEALSMPWLLLGATLGCSYLARAKLRVLVAATVVTGVAFLLRPQTGLCCAVIVALPLLSSLSNKDKAKHLITAAFIGIFIFLFAGIPDIYWHSDYHYSLKAITIHNYKHGSAYNAQPWFFYFPIIFIFMAGPFLFKRYGTNFWIQFRDLKVPLLFMVAFSITHLAFANKFERFLFPWFGVMLLLLEPFVRDLFDHYRQHRLRIGAMLLANFLIWIPASFGAAQKNLIDLPKFLNDQKEISQVWLVDKPVEWFAQILVQRSMNIDEVSFEDVKSKNLKGYFLFNKNRMDELSHQRSNELSNCQVVQNFGASFIDSLAYRFNPEKNQRRAPLILLKCDF